jgi:hypothetical protein
VLLDRGEERVEVLDRGQKLHIRYRLEEGRGTLADQVVVFGEDDAEGHGRMVHAGSGRADAIGGRAA